MLVQIGWDAHLMPCRQLVDSLTLQPFARFEGGTRPILGSNIAQQARSAWFSPPRPTTFGFGIATRSMDLCSMAVEIKEPSPRIDALGPSSLDSSPGLGMKHSSNRDDVMWPYYRLARGCRDGTSPDGAQKVVDFGRDGTWNRSPLRSSKYLKFRFPSQTHLYMF